jgi:nucleotide-binding universal stress UspA family protein
VVGTANDTGMEILRMAEDSHADLIVIATHGMSGWRQLAFGSVAEKVVRLSTFPVLVMRARAENKSIDAPPTRDSAAVAR